MLIAATSLFAGKFHYVGLDRYYQPIKPLYFVLFGAPLLFWRRNLAHAGVAVWLLVGASWIVEQEWLRPLRRQAVAGSVPTPYGAEAQCFGSDAARLYEWLRNQQRDDLVVLSNYHEFLVLEAGIPALPIPADPGTLQRWLGDIREARSVQDLRVLFVLDPDNGRRGYWIEEPSVVEAKFDLTRLSEPAFSGVHIAATP
jgi:hypothetical protein